MSLQHLAPHLSINYPIITVLCPKSCRTLVLHDKQPRAMALGLITAPDTAQVQRQMVISPCMTIACIDA